MGQFYGFDRHEPGKVICLCLILRTYIDNMFVMATETKFYRIVVIVFFREAGRRERAGHRSSVLLAFYLIPYTYLS